MGSIKGTAEGKCQICISGSEGKRDRQQSGDPKKYSSYKSGIDTKQETQTLSVPGKGRGPKTATEKFKKSKCTDFIQNREKSFLSHLPPLALSTWGKCSPWFRAARARRSRPGSCLGPFLPLCSSQKLQGLWVPQPKSQGLLNTDGKKKKQNKTQQPATCTFSSKTVQKQTSMGSPFCRILKAPI